MYLYMYITCIHVLVHVYYTHYLYKYMKIHMHRALLERDRNETKRTIRDNKETDRKQTL